MLFSKFTALNGVHIHQPGCGAASAGGSRGSGSGAGTKADGKAGAGAGVAGGEGKGVNKHIGGEHPTASDIAITSPGTTLPAVEKKVQLCVGEGKAENGNQKHGAEKGGALKKKKGGWGAIQKAVVDDHQYDGASKLAAAVQTVITDRRMAVHAGTHTDTRTRTERQTD